MTKLFTFRQALAHAEHSSPNLLLGNGFSQACRADIFSYRSLFESADFGKLSPKARTLFDVLGTTDFEVVMNALKSASQVVAHYDPDDEEFPTTLYRDGESLKEVLVSAIAGNHPVAPYQISDESYWSCRHFLANFGSIYSLNYDLLLYWTLMHDDPPSQQPLNLKCDDGFRSPLDGETLYVTWDIENSNSQNIFYLHGALHLFDAGADLIKYTWCNTGIRIIDQVRQALDEDLYPLFVAEGQSEQKLASIKHSGYLSRGLRSFAQTQKPLFLFGLSLGESDQHILQLIERGKMEAIYVSIFGDPDAPANRKIMRRAKSLAAKRKLKYPLKVNFFCAESANVWNGYVPFVQHIQVASNA